MDGVRLMLLIVVFLTITVESKACCVNYFSHAPNKSGYHSEYTYTYAGQVNDRPYYQRLWYGNNVSSFLYFKDGTWRVGSSNLNDWENRVTSSALCPPKDGWSDSGGSFPVVDCIPPAGCDSHPSGCGVATTQPPTTYASTTTSPIASTTATATPTTTTAVTTTTLPSGLIQFYVVMNITNVSEFLQEPELESVLRECMAELCGVDSSWIENIMIVQLRRLAPIFLGQRELASDFEMTTADGSIRIEFDVVIPPDGGPGQVTARFLMEKFDATSVVEASEIVNRVLKSGFLGLQDYSVQIIVKSGTIKRQRHIAVAPAPSPPEEGLSIIVSVIAVIASVCLLVTLVLIFAYARKVKNRRPDSDRSYLIDNRTDFTEAQLLFPSRTISADRKAQLLDFVLSMINYTCPIVFVCFADGQQDDDENLSGIGLSYAGVVIQALYNNGIPCRTSLPATMEAETSTCLEFLSGRTSDLKLVLLNETREVYRCRKCLEQIYTALKGNIDIVRLQFEADLPSEEYQWRNLRHDDLKGLQMREFVRETLPSRTMLPEPPETIQSVPDCLKVFAMDLSRKHTALESLAANSTASASQSGIESSDVALKALTRNIGKAFSEPVPVAETINASRKISSGKCSNRKRAPKDLVPRRKKEKPWRKVKSAGAPMSCSESTGPSVPLKPPLPQIIDSTVD